MASNESITYDEVSQWWDNGEYYMSDYPPSAWHNYLAQEGITLDELEEDPAKFEAGVAELHEAGDGRKCECEWAEHEPGCTDPAAKLDIG
jgi:hypothetical protein